MPRYTDSSKDRVRDAIDMVELVGARVELKRSGTNRMVGLCPFHDERSPSFGIDPSRGLYHCFGCGAGGDAFAFVMETEGLDFVGALEYLADRYSIQLDLEAEDPRDAEKRKRRERLLELLERTATYYVRLLWESPEAATAREYLVGRGLDEGVLREFRVGWAPRSYDRVIMASQKAGFGNAELREAGLMRERGGRRFDAFHAQVVFPLCDGRGRVQGFAGRVIDPDDQRPKYLNSVDSDLFHKRRQLFGADLARAAAAKAGNVILAEGYTDVIALHQAGLRNAVATMGTSLTEEQVVELARLAPVVNLALDSDNAGQEAMLRAARVAAGRNLDLRVVQMPAGEDPADLVRRAGAEEVERLVGESVPFVRFRVLRALETGDLRDAEGKDRVLAELRAVFASLGPSVQRQELVALVAERMSLPDAMVASLLAGGGGTLGSPAARSEANGSAKAGPPAPPRQAAVHERQGRREQVEKTFLTLCIAFPGPGAQALEEIEPERDLTWPPAQQMAVHLRTHLADPAEGLDASDEVASRLAQELAIRAARAETRATPADLRKEQMQLRLARLDREIAASRRDGTAGIAELSRQRHETKAALDAETQG